MPRQTHARTHARTHSHAHTHTHRRYVPSHTQSYITCARALKRPNKHAHTQAGMQTHLQAPMPTNESFFTDVMPLLLRLRTPKAAVGQEPERTSGAPSRSPENTQPPNVTFQGLAASAELERERSRRLLTCLLTGLLRGLPIAVRIRPRCDAPTTSHDPFPPLTPTLNVIRD